MERIRSIGAMLITAPTDDERLYEMAVRLTRAELIALPGYVLMPSITIRANCVTGDVLLGAAITPKRIEDQ